jgi:hypothetical protein
MYYEPLLAVRRPRPFFLRRRFLRSFLPVAFLAVSGLVALLVSGTPLVLPFERLVLLTGLGGSNIHFLEDGRVSEVLLRHHIRAQGDDVGSRTAAILGRGGANPAYDFVFASGQPAAEQVHQERRDSKVYHPFTSPLVLATFRDYAETLSAKHIVTPQAVSQPFDKPYYYDLDMEDFLTLENTSWDALDGPAHGVTNSNVVLAQSTNVCTSNGAETYLGLVSFVRHGRVPSNQQEAVSFANDIKPLLRGQGLPLVYAELKYFSESGRQIAPIVVMYEHQYLASQLDHLKRFGKLDDDRVLLYPKAQLITQPAFIALNDNAKRLGELLITDPDLRMRALELGFRVFPRTGDEASKQLPGFLAERGVPVPSAFSDTNAKLPANNLLEAMIKVVGDCP